MTTRKPVSHPAAPTGRASAEHAGARRRAGRRPASCPPSASTRSRRLVSPCPLPVCRAEAGAVVVHQQRAAAVRRGQLHVGARSALACLTTLVSASQTTKYAAPRHRRRIAGRAAPRRRGPMTSSGSRPARASTAATRPPSVSTGGWMPCASSRRSASSSPASACSSASSVSGDSPRPSLVAGQPELGDQRDDLLLHTVVDVALDPAPLGVLRGDDPRPRPGQFGQPLARAARSAARWRSRWPPARTAWPAAPGPSRSYPLVAWAALDPPDHLIRRAEAPP